MSKIKTKTYYVASARCQQVKYSDGSIATAEGTEVWLGMAEGYRSCSHVRSEAKHFTTPDQIRAIWTGWDGMPWYFRLAPDSLRILKVTEEHFHSITEEDVTSL